MYIIIIILFSDGQIALGASSGLKLASFTLLSRCYYFPAECLPLRGNCLPQLRARHSSLMSTNHCAQGLSLDHVKKWQATTQNSAWSLFQHQPAHPSRTSGGCGGSGGSWQVFAYCCHHWWHAQGGGPGHHQGQCSVFVCCDWQWTAQCRTGRKQTVKGCVYSFWQQWRVVCTALATVKGHVYCCRSSEGLCVLLWQQWRVVYCSWSNEGLCVLL